MKLIKMTTYMLTLLSITNVALAVGPRSTVQEYNGGEFICADFGPGVKNGRGPAVVTPVPAQDDHRLPATNSQSAQ